MTKILSIKEEKTMDKLLQVGDFLQIKQDGNQVAIMKKDGCLAEDVAGFGDTIVDALRSLAEEIEKQTK